MEKKGNRNSLVSRNSPTDSKKDGVSSRQWPRGSRRREPPGGSLSTKGEPSRKPQPQRVKSNDKRPRARGGGNTGAVARTEASWIEENEAELGSVFLPGSKKQSLNHILNIQYAPYTPKNGYQPQKASKSSKMLTTKKHKYNKEHFLQANCQFVVKDGGDYKQYLNNPDALVDWNLIEQVNVQVSEFPSCPICLYPPVAAKMTRCGHIYCWSCMLHYLSLSDEPSRKCPICFENVYKQDLKSATAIPHSTFNVTETITFKLMKRPRGCLTAYPADAEVKGDNIIFNMSEKDVGGVYSKLLLANSRNVLSIIAREAEELQRQVAEDDNCPERCFTEQAMTLLRERKDKVLGELKSEQVYTNFDEEECIVNDEKDACSEISIADVDSERVGKVNHLFDSLNISRDNTKQPSKFHYFYQASDGQHIYLHAINARMLEHTYGSLEFGPRTITGKILEKEGASMTEDLRKRLRYLQHLPVTCQFEVAEIHLKQPIVKKETLEEFHEQIEKRRRKRQHRAKEEKRREKRIEAEENRRMGRYPTPNIQLESNIQFPEFGMEARIRSESEGTLPSERSSSPDLFASSSSLSVENVYAGPSFATMLATEKKQAPIWPNLKTSSPLNPVKMINVTGSKMKVNTIVRVHKGSDVEPEDYEPVPEYNKSFGDAIAAALQQAEEKVEDTDPPALGKKKKKKNKQKVLFATNMAYSVN